MNLFASLFIRKSASESKSEAYRRYTTEFDREVKATELDSVLGMITPENNRALEEAWETFQNGLLAWRTRSHIAALDASAEIRSALPESRLTDCVFTLLVDQSGSMRGQNMLLAAAAIDVAQDFLGRLGCSVEILGFTTTSWKGGKSRQKWVSRGSPHHPGRLCDLLHIVYKSTNSASSGTGSWTLRPMLRPDLLKENVDGEALEWALGRLQIQPQSHKFLIVVSDGAPVDDSTLKQNGGTYMEDHLKSVIAQLEARRSVHLAAVGIGHNVARYYKNGITVQTPDDLGQAMIGQIKDLVLSLPAITHIEPDLDESASQ